MCFARVHQTPNNPPRQGLILIKPNLIAAGEVFEKPQHTSLNRSAAVELIDLNTSARSRQVLITLISRIPGKPGPAGAQGVS